MYTIKPIKPNSYIKILVEERKDQYSKYFLMEETPYLYDDITRSIKYDFYLLHSIYKNPIYTIIVAEDDQVLYIGHPRISDTLEQELDYFCRLFYTEYYDKMSSHDKSVRLESYIEKLNKLEQDNYEKIIAKRKEINYSMILPLINSLKANDTIKLSQLAHLDVTLNLDPKFVSLGLKVGIDKMYVIQSQSMFIHLIEEELDFKYGKNLELKHSMENFDERSQKLIFLLKNIISHNTEFSVKSVQLNGFDLDELFNIMKGTTLSIDIDYDSTLCYVSLDNYEFNIELNEKYELVLDKYPKVIYGEKDIYVIDNSDIKKVVFPNKVNKKSYRKLIESLYDNKENNPSFEYLIDEFRKEIYPRFKGIIKVNEDIEENVGVVDYQIRSYFDYNDSLTLNTKYFRNDEEVPFEEAKDYLVSYNQYENYIKELGFEENHIDDMVKIVNFLRSDLSPLQEISDVYLSENIKKLQVKKANKISAKLSYSVGMCQIFFNTSDYSDKDLLDIIRSMKKKLRYVKLKNDTILDLDDPEIKKFYNTVNEFDLDIRNLTKPSEVSLFQSLKLLDKDLDICEYKVDKKLKELIEDISNYKKNDYPYPSDLKDIARSYQIDAYKWMKTLIKYGFCGILADDMGLGKTFEVISVIKTDEVNKPSLVVCPKSLCFNWKNEFSLWAKEIEVINIIGNSDVRKTLLEENNSNKKIVFVTSYDSLRNDIDNYVDIDFRFMILDEAQSIKNHETLKAQSVRKIKSELRFVLTGTPIENSVLDLWSIFDFLMPKYLGDFSEFRGKYERAIVESDSTDAINRLVKKITPFVLRRTKEDELKDLPSKVEYIQMASMKPKQQMVYDAQILRVRNQLKDPKASKIEILAILTRLRQICVDPGMFMENYEGGCCKVDLLMELVHNYIDEGHKIVVFSQFTMVFPKIEKFFKKDKIEYFLLTGDTPAKQRVDMATEFNKKESKEKVFLVSLKAGGTGLNLVGADVVIHLDPWWNYAAETQATDRTHRIGQTNSVSVIKLVVENSIEQKVIELQNIKKDLASKIIRNESDSMEKLSIDDIKFLLD